jgi:GTP-binding protein EngB required for normal cell division
LLPADSIPRRGSINYRRDSLEWRDSFEFRLPNKNQVHGAAIEAKIVVMGSSRVGKSAMVTTITTQNYPGDEYIETIGATFAFYSPRG